MPLELKNSSARLCGVLPSCSSSILAPLKTAALLAVAGISLTAEAGEVAAFAKVYSWPDGVNNFNSYTKASGGSLTPAAAGNGWKSHASASFHGLAAGGSAASPGTAGFSRGYVGGSAYWFEQITISSPSVAVGTQGRANLTLYFEGDLDAESQGNGRENQASFGYRVASNGAGENVATPDVGDSGYYVVYAGLGYKQTGGNDFRNLPCVHQIYFNYGQPCDLTIAVHSQAQVYRDAPGKVRTYVRCTGWNGFHDIRLSSDAPVTDATITSQTGFNYANAGSTSYAQWASQYQLDSASMQADSNGNRLPNLLEYALGRNPLDPNSSPPVTRGVVNIGGSDYQSITFTRPRLGARAGDIIYLPQRSDGLSGWTTTGMETTVAPSTTDTETVTVRSTQPQGTQASEFLRLEVTGP
ncbi:hypothetical protein [Luteolibacter sp. Populi]|uniref:hypothetical protein n=1 Tax=Luteolibacter sp. Populi TaxID=3230487 RepID=UPI0034656246